MVSPLWATSETQVQQVVQSQRVRDTNGRQKISLHQNIFDADFEYGAQPLRWESLTYNTTYEIGRAHV